MPTDVCVRAGVWLMDGEVFFSLCIPQMKKVSPLLKRINVARHEGATAAGDSSRA